MAPIEAAFGRLAAAEALLSAAAGQVEAGRCSVQRDAI